MRLFRVLPIALFAVASCATSDGDEGSTTAAGGGAATGGGAGSSMAGGSTAGASTSGTSGGAGASAGQGGAASTGVGPGGSTGSSAATGVGGGSSGGASGGAGANRDAGADRGSPGGNALDASREPDGGSDAAGVPRADATDDRGSQDASTDGSQGANPEPGRLAGITAFHNQVRAAVGVGSLTWDPTIASTAAAYAANCNFQHSGAAGLGENLSAYAPPGGRAASAPVNDWASERASYDYASNTCAAGAVCGHYTQVVWRNSLRLGCAVQACSVNSPFMGFPNWEIWVCNYAPAGNVGTQRPY